MKTDLELHKWLEEQGVSGIAMDGYADCFIGYAPAEDEVDNEVTLYYDFNKVIRKLMSMGMSEEDAVDYHNYNQLYGGVVFLDTPYAPEDK